MKYKRKEVIGDATLYLADCMDVMPHLDEVDAVVTDPPYGINLDKGFSGAVGFSGKGKKIKRRKYKGDWDNRTPEKTAFDEIVKYTSIIWGGNYFTNKLQQGSFWLVWDKENTMPTFSDCELAWSNIKKKSVKRIKYMQNGCISKEKERFHPTQKPVEVIKWCIEQFQDAPKTILDPFMGSGTTGVAALAMGRKFIGIELDEEYFDIACQRIKQEHDQLKLF